MAWWRLDLGSLARARAGRRAARRRPVRTDAPPGTARAVLSECCTFRSPAVLLDRDSGERIEARFGALGEDEVRLDLPPGTAPGTLRPLSVCLATFAHRGGAAVFLSRVRRIDEPAAGEVSRQIALALPQQVAEGDLRAAPRFPTPRGCGFGVRIDPGGPRAVEAQPLDLSLCGIRLELDSGEAEGLGAGDRLELELRLDDRRTRVWGEVRRREGTSIALCFAHCLREGRVQPPPELTRLVGDLEQRARRLRGHPGRPAPDGPALPVGH